MFFTIKLCSHAKLILFEIEQIFCIKIDLALNNLQRLICHKIQPTNQPTYCGMGAYPSAEMKSVYSTVPADWTVFSLNRSIWKIINIR